MIFWYFQLKREISQTRTKSKDFVHTYLHEIVPEIQIPPGPISSSKAKEARVDALKHLVEQKERYLYRLPIYEKVNGKDVKIRGPHDPYRGPYIRNAVRFLLLEEDARFKSVPHEELTIPLLAYVCTLV